MSGFEEGLRWTAYGDGGFADKRSLALEDANGQQLSGIAKTPQGGYIALSLVTGGVLGNVKDFEGAVTAAEEEALHPVNP